MNYLSVTVNLYVVPNNYYVYYSDYNISLKSNIILSLSFSLSYYTCNFGATNT